MRPSLRSVPYQLQVAGPQELASIHEATLDVLWQAGAVLEAPEAIELLASAGAMVQDGGLVRIPPRLVERAIETAPSTPSLFSRDGLEAMKLAPGRVYCGTGSDCPNVIDHETRQRRRAVKRDIETFSRLSDALPNIDFVMSMALASDRPASTADLHHFQAMVENTTKPVCFTVVTHENLVRICDLAAMIAGGHRRLGEKPFLMLYGMPSPPLRHSHVALENLIYCARHSIPVVYASGTSMGITGPMTIAGSTVSSNADVLAGLVVHQLAHPGAPFIYGVGVTAFDMRTTIDAYGAPEHHLADALGAQVALYYELPSWGYAANTDSKVLDLQACMEFVAATTMGMLSRCNLLHDVGYLESGMTASCESLVLGNEVIEYVRRTLQPVPIDARTLAVEAIKRMGPGGTYLTERLTLENHRDFWYSSLVDRRRYDGWVRAGRLTMEERLQSRVREILASHQPVLLDPAAAERVESYMLACDQRAASVTGVA